MKIFGALLVFWSSIALGSSDSEDFYQKKMERNLDLASIWLIESGASSFHKGGKEILWRKLVDEWGVQLWVDPWIESDRYIIGFWIKARGIHYDILNLHRVPISGALYEFWAVKIYGRDWTNIKNTTVFYVTKTNSVDGDREILERSEKFIDTYKIDGSQEIAFPTNDLAVLYELSAWDFPDSYEGSTLAQKKVMLGADGQYKFVE